MLTLTRSEKIAIQDVMDYAGRHKITRSDVAEMFAGKKPPPGDNQKFSCRLRAGKRHYRVVFTYSEQPLGWTRHLSASSVTGDRLQLEDLNDILRRFQFRTQLTGLEPQQTGIVVYFEKAGAVNVVEPVDEEVERKMAAGGGAVVAEAPTPRTLVITDPRALQ